MWIEGRPHWIQPDSMGEPVICPELKAAEDWLNSGTVEERKARAMNAHRANALGDYRVLAQNEFGVDPLCERTGKTWAIADRLVERMQPVLLQMFVTGKPVRFMAAWDEHVTITTSGDVHPDDCIVVLITGPRETAPVVQA